jgi:7-keto-8-aminopelargonate synthetase-like enzyme
MRRIVWVAVGAAGGIYAYRRAQQAMIQARDRGVVLSAQQAGASAAAALTAARLMAQSTSLRSAPEGDRTPGSAAARVIAAARATTRSSTAPHENQESSRGLR